MSNQKILIFIENGVVYPTIKVQDHDRIEVLVVNNDLSTIWRPKVEYGCDEEIELAARLSRDLRANIKGLEDIIKD